MTSNKKVIQKITYKPIGVIRSPFTDIQDMPIQPAGAKGISGKIEIFPEYAGGLKDLEGFSHIILLYHFHLSDGFSLKVKPFLDIRLRGIFSTRAPKRPNPIGISVVRLIAIKGNILSIEDVDVVDETPLLDIKPYFPKFDVHRVKKSGWLAQKSDNVHKIKSDKRFR